MGKKKDDLVVDAGTALVSVAEILPGVSSLVKVVRTLYGAHQERRLDMLWDAVAAADHDPQELYEQIEDALNKDGPTLGVGFIAAARAAADAFDLAVIPTIGLLAQRHLRTGTPGRVEYRDLLSMLTGLDAEEFGALRTAFHAMALVPGDEKVVVKLMPDAAGVWILYAIVHPTPTGQNEQQTYILGTGPIIIRAVDALERLGRRHFHVTSSPATSPDRKGSVDRETVRLFVDIMPLPGGRGG